MLGPVVMFALACPSAPTPADATPARVAEALASGALRWQFSGPGDVRALLGSPANESIRPDGAMDILLQDFGPTLSVVLGRPQGSKAPFGLLAYGSGDKWRQRDSKDPLRPRTLVELDHLNPFTGLQGVDVSGMDLREAVSGLAERPFDTLTRWPPSERLPKGFDPGALLEAGKNPGLGVRQLHAKGLDGRGLDVGVIDQPLVKDHVETSGRLQVAAEIDVAGVPPQMHGPAVSSLAAGASCGVAPKARLQYVSLPMWKSSEGNAMYVRALEGLLELNRTGRGKVRAVSISYGGFPQAPGLDAWTAVLKRAEAEGVLVITCDLKASGLDYGLLRPLSGGDRDKPEGYTKGRYGTGLLVPGDGRAYASPHGSTVYSYNPRGGMSWGAPWLAGLATLGFQANPSLTPARVRAYLVRSATSMPYGQVVNPAAFIALCQADPDANPSR